MDKKTLIAFVLSAVVLITWQVLFPPPPPVKPKAVVTTDTIIPEVPVPAGIPELSAPGMPAMDTSPLADTSPARAIVVEREAWKGTFAETGALITSLTFKNYHSETLPVSVVSEETDAIGHLALVMDQADRAGLSRMRWKASDGETMQFSLSPLTAEIPAGISINKTYRNTGEYGLVMTLEITNHSGQAVEFSSAKLESPLHDETKTGSFLLHLGPDLGRNPAKRSHVEQYLVTGSYELDGQKEQATTEKSWWHSIFGDPDPAFSTHWVALENRYFAIALLPKEFSIDAAFFKDKSGHTRLWTLLPEFKLDHGASKSFEFSIFSGPKATETLAAFNPELELLDGMEPTVLPKKLPIARWMVAILRWINGFVHNWGVSIILLTVAVRGLLFPLAQYQFKSMAKMQALKPKIDELQARYAKDKERMQRELMKVYSEAGVNPLGGCLPLILQMPILIGLFLALQNSIELRGVPFALWIKDLSVPDTLIYLLGIPINPLPVLMGATMHFQQKLTPMPSADPAQKQVMMMMPWLMVVMFYNFPSGLSLYWVTQNILSIAQQYHMMKSKEAVTAK